MKRKQHILTLILLLLIVLSACSKEPAGEPTDEEKYQKAIELYDDGEFEEAKEIFMELDGFEDSSNYSKQCVVMAELQGTWRSKNDYFDITGHKTTGNIFGDCVVSLDGEKIITTKRLPNGYLDVTEWRLSYSEGEYILSSRGIEFIKTN